MGSSCCLAQLGSTANSLEIAYTTEDDAAEVLRFRTPHAPFLQACIDEVQVERIWKRAIDNGTVPKKKNVRRCSAARALTRAAGQGPVELFRQAVTPWCCACTCLRRQR